MEDDVGFDVRSMLGLLRRRASLIATTVIVVAVFAGLLLLVLKPVYSASAVVLFDPAQKNLLSAETPYSSDAQASARVDGEVELVTVEQNLLQLISDEHLIDDDEFGVKLDFKTRVLAALRLGSGDLPTGEAALAVVMSNVARAVDAKRVGNTYLVAIEAKSLSPQRAADIANALAKIYIKGQVAAKIDSTQQAHDVLQGRLEDANKSMVSSEEQFDKFIDDNIDQIAAETGRSDLVRLKDDLQSQQKQRVMLSDRYSNAAQSLQSKDWDSLSTALQDEALGSLASQQAALKAAMAGQAALPAADQQDLQTRLADINQRLQAVGEQGVSALQKAVSDAQAKASNDRDNIRNVVLKANLPTSILADIYSIQQTSEIARTQYQSLLSRLKDLETQAAIQVADSRIVSQATPPSRPSFPNSLLILSAAAGIALVLGVTLAVLYENFIGGFTSEAQLASVLRLGAVTSLPIPKAKDGKGSGSIAGLVASDPLSAFAEEVRGLRVRIEQISKRLQRRQPERGTVIVVTSSVPNEGKTTVSLSLARVYAQAGIKTVLIDGDLRKPSLHTELGLPPSSDLGNLLSLTSGDGRQVDYFRDPDTGLAIVRGDTLDAALQLTTAQPALARAIERLKSQFEVVVVDTSPAGIVVDALYVAELADIVVFVVRASATSQIEAQATASKVALSMQDGSAMVAVLNRLQSFSGTHSAKYSAYYGGGASAGRN